MAIREVIVEDKKFNISYEILNKDKTKNIIFLHGWGSNKEIMKRAFNNNFKEFRHIYIDMPGFGKSSNSYVLTTKDYANIIDKFLMGLNLKKDVIIGHSFGGKVATLLNPELLVLLASAGIVLEKPIDVKIKIKIFKLLKKLGLSKFRNFFVSSDVKGMSEEMYEIFKNVVDEDFSEVFKNYNGEVLIFGGDKDTAVPRKAIEKQAKLFNRNFIMLSGNHYFFLNKKENTKKIEEEIKRRLK